MSAMLEVENLTASYGAARVLHGISFKVEEGSITVLLGANGAGKTTTLRALTGMVRTTGSVRFRGELVSGKKTETIASLGIAHVPDGRGTFLGMSTEENLWLGAYTRNDRQEVAAEIARVYELFPPAWSAEPSTGRHFVRRRAANAGDIARADDETFADVA